MPGLKPSARAFVKAAFAVLAERAKAYTPTKEGLGRWTSRGNSDFVLEPRTLSAEETCLDTELLIAFPDVTERRPFREAVAADSRLAPFLDKLVGTSLSTSRVDVDGLERSLLWSVFRATGSFKYSDSGFEKGYARWLADELASEERLALLVPLSGVTAVGEIDLGDGIKLGQLSDEEIESLLGARMMPEVFGYGPFVNVMSRAALRSELAMERKADAEVSAEGAALATQKSDAVLEVVAALRVYRQGRVAPTGVAWRSDDGRLWTVPSPSGSARAPGPAMTIEAKSDRKNFVRFWNHFKVARRTRTIDAVVRRFSYAGDRTRRDDQIVDLVAALERCFSQTKERALN